MRSIWPATIAIALGCGAAAAPGTESPSTPDPWKDKPKSDVVLLLGEPSKTKRAKDGAETLVYKLVLLENASAPAPEMLVLDLPGVGLVGKPYDLRGPGGPEMTVEPLELDSQGRPVGGGPTVTERVSTEIDLETHKKTITSKGEPTRSAITRRISVSFEVGPDGRVRDWSVSGKK
jgi:hypothetical protein